MTSCASVTSALPLRSPALAAIVAALSMSVAASGCVEQSTELTSQQRQELRAFVSTSAPSPSHELDISFENKIRLIGYDLTEPVRAGEPFTVTWYWKAERALDEGWRIFTHIADAAGDNRMNADSTGRVRELYQPGRWKAGEYIKDVQQITLPADWNSPQAVFYMGVWNGPHRLRIVTGSNDGDNRARALSIDVGGAPAATRPDPGTALPEARATRTAEAPTLDGKLDEGPWGQTPATSAFVNTMSGAPAEPNATARFLWDDSHLYVGVEVEDAFLKSDFTERDANLWEADAVELFVDPDGDGRNYYELQVSPAGVVFDTRYDAPRQPAAPGHVDWDSEMRVGVDTAGTPNDDEADERYTVELAIPWASFGSEGAPTADARWRVNLFVMDMQADGSQRAVAWSPPRTGDFHVPARFGNLVFAAPGAPAARLPPGLIDQIRGRGLNELNVGLSRPDQAAPGEVVPTRDNPNPGATAMRQAPTAMSVTPMAPPTED